MSGYSDHECIGGREESMLVVVEDRNDRAGERKMRRRPWLMGLFNLCRTVRWL